MAEKVWAWTGSAWSSTIPADSGGAGSGEVAALTVRVGLLESAQAVSGPLASAALPRTEVSGLLSDALSNYVTASKLGAVLSTVFYFLDYGTGWPQSRPADAGDRPLLATRGPAAPTWATRNTDFWLATI